MLTVKDGSTCDRAKFGDIDWEKTGRKFTTFAVLNADGWCELGQMGWWGLSSETPEEAKQWRKKYWNRFLKDLKPETWISVYDCHI